MNLRYMRTTRSSNIEDGIAIIAITFIEKRCHHSLCIMFNSLIPLRICEVGKEHSCWTLEWSISCVTPPRLGPLYLCQLPWKHAIWPIWHNHNFCVSQESGCLVRLEWWTATHKEATRSECLFFSFGLGKVKRKDRSIGQGTGSQHRHLAIKGRQIGIPKTNTWHVTNIT